MGAGALTAIVMSRTVGWPRAAQKLRKKADTIRHSATAAMIALRAGRGDPGPSEVSGPPAMISAASSGSGSALADACPGSDGDVVMLIDGTPWLTSMAAARNVVTKIDSGSPRLVVGKAERPSRIFVACR
jgi:hypothetical protein